VAIVVVTGTGTGVGKTYVSAALAALSTQRGWPTAYLKLAQTGVPGDIPDTETVQRLAPDTTTVEGARYEPALSPAAAARATHTPPPDLHDLAGLAQDLERQHRLVVVEGAGGLLVRYDEDGATLADLARDLGAPVLVVAEPGLGTLNTTALTLEALAHRGIQLDGLVIGAWPEHPGQAERSNIGDLETISARPLAGALPRGAGKDPAHFVETARTSLAPQYGGTFDAQAFRNRWRQ
jgi:dethiobiotin synthetase